jgi:DNA mismatch repair protein MutL
MRSTSVYELRIRRYRPLSSLFDRIIRQAGQQVPESQPLLVTQPVELTPSQEETLADQGDLLAAYGFAVEHFGGNGYLLRAVPGVMTSGDPGQSLTDILDMVVFEGVVRQSDDTLAASVACHSAIRAGDALTEPEMVALLEQLEKADNPHTCPHGRPTLIHFSEYQMEREFGRR